jgi:solute carrier family 41
MFIALSVQVKAMFYTYVTLVMCCAQCQAIVVGFLASLAAMIMGWVPEGKFDVAHGLLLCASSLVTAAVASFMLGEQLRKNITHETVICQNPHNS